MNEVLEKFDDLIRPLLTNDGKTHAYLIEIDNEKYEIDIAKHFAKFFMCREKKISVDCNECDICNLIDNNNCLDLCIIEPDDGQIKKEQIIDLKKSFNTKAFDNSLRVYIINEAEKLNASASNSLLKFLEEPEDGIIAILVTSNHYNIIDTILSRCQLLKFPLNTSVDDDKQLVAVTFVNLLYEKGLNTIAYANDIFHKYVVSKNDILLILRNIEKIYHLLLKKKFDNSIIIDEKLRNVFLNIEIDDIINKIKVIENYQKKLKYNVNVKLWFDGLIINLLGGEKND